MLVVGSLVRGVSENSRESLASWGGCWVDSQVSTVVRRVMWVGIKVSRDVVVSEVWAVLLVL